MWVIENRFKIIESWSNNHVDLVKIQNLTIIPSYNEGNIQCYFSCIEIISIYFYHNSFRFLYCHMCFTHRKVI